MIAALLALTVRHSLIVDAAWTPVTLSYYSSGKRTADGTKMSLDGKWVATYREPLGAVLEVRVGKVTQRLVVRDRTAKRYGKRLDLPRNTWLRYGHPASRGLLRGEYRRLYK